DAGVTREEAQNAVDAVRHVYDPRKLDIGDTVALSLDKPGSIGHMSLPVSSTSTVELTRNAKGNFETKQASVPVERKLARAGGRIDSSLYETGVGSGLPPALVQEIINAYSYDVDFQRDIKNGDGIDVLFEQLRTPSGTHVGHGNVIFAELNLNGRDMK